jgi:hypothetical protein
VTDARLAFIRPASASLVTSWTVCSYRKRLWQAVAHENGFVKFDLRPDLDAPR